LQRGDLEGAARQVAEALDHFRRAGHRRGEVEAQARKGLILGLAGQTSEAIDLLTLAAAQAQEMGERPLERVTRLNLFKFLFESGQLEAALPHLERGLELAREPQDPRIAGLFLNNLGVVHRARGELGRALECFREALEVAERAGIAQYRVWRRLTLAENYLDLGSPALARPLLEAAGKLAEESGLGEVEAWRLALLARCELMEGHPEAVPPMLAPLLEAELADHNDRARAAWLLGAAWLRQGEPEKALQVTAGLEALPAFQVRLMAVALEARLFLGQPGDLEAAQGLLEDPGVALLESFDLRRVLLRALRAAGQSEAATRLARDSARRLAQIAATLRADPELQHSFLSLYQDLLG
jgi:tetratricopeptide (TPR) repeat protein